MKRLLAILVAGCFATAASAAERAGTVSVSIPPQAYFVKQIAGDTVDVNILVPANANEHAFEFKPSAMKKLEKSQLYFTIDLEFERVFAEKFAKNFPKLKIIDTQEGIKLLPGEDHEHEDHEHDAHEEHDHDEHAALDPHSWLDPILVQTMAKNIYEALAGAYPQNAELYKGNLTKFLAALDSLNLQISGKFEGLKSRDFVVYHPSWAYFAARYDLRQIPIEALGKEPKAADLKRLIQEIKDKKIKLIFVQPGFAENAAKSLAAQTGAKIYEINHLAADWQNELLKTADAIAQSLK